MAQDKRPGTLVKFLIFLFFLIVAFLVYSFAIGRQPPVGEGEVTVVTALTGGEKIYHTGERPFVFPFIQKSYMLRTGAMVVSLVDDEGMSLSKKGKKETRIESRVTYKIDDVQKALNSFGLKDTHREIRKRIKEAVARSLKDKVTGIETIDKAENRIPLIADIHIGLSETFKKDGLKILSYRIRFR